ncbi:MAG: hypothetical protein ACLUIQ_11165 [Dialister invisus]
MARFNVKVTSIHGYFGTACPTVGVILPAMSFRVKIWNWRHVCVLVCGADEEVHYPDNKGASADQLHCRHSCSVPVFYFRTMIYWPSAAAMRGIMFGK